MTSSASRDVTNCLNSLNRLERVVIQRVLTVVGVIALFNVVELTLLCSAHAFIMTLTNEISLAEMALSPFVGACV